MVQWHNLQSVHMPTCQHTYFCVNHEAICAGQTQRVTYSNRKYGEALKPAILAAITKLLGSWSVNSQCFESYKVLLLGADYFSVKADKIRNF